jgi:hypothetical protein
MVNPLDIQPWSIWDDETISHQLGLSPEAIAAGRKAGVLEYAKIGGRVFYKGCWVMDWIHHESSAEAKKRTNMKGKGASGVTKYQETSECHPSFKFSETEE